MIKYSGDIQYLTHWKYHNKRWEHHNNWFDIIRKKNLKRSYHHEIDVRKDNKCTNRDTNIFH